MAVVVHIEEGILALALALLLLPYPCAVGTPEPVVHEKKSFTKSSTDEAIVCIYTYMSSLYIPAGEEGFHIHYVVAAAAAEEEPVSRKALDDEIAAVAVEDGVDTLAADEVDSLVAEMEDMLLAVGHNLDKLAAVAVLHRAAAV